MTMRLVLLTALVTPALAWYRTAISVEGAVVKEAGNLTMGGKVGTYTVLLQVLNPPAGDLELLLECCDGAKHLAGEAAMGINENTVGSYDDIKANYKGEGKCSEPGVLELLNQGNPSCNYLYSFKYRDWKTYSNAAFCVPSDVCSVDVVGATKGLALTYGVVLQILNVQAGDLQYAGKGDISSCLAGMNQVNEANHSFFNKEKAIEVDILGTKVPIGSHKYIDIKGMTQMNPIEMLSKCDPTPSTGVLYIYSNKYWDDKYQSMNISGYNEKVAVAKIKEEVQKLQDDIDKLTEEQKQKIQAGSEKKISEAQAAEKKEEKSESKPPPLKGFDLAAALGDIATKLKKDIKEDPKVAKSPEAMKEVMNKEEANEKETIEEKAEEAKEALPKVPKVPASAPETPKVEVPEAPKAPEAPPAPVVPKVEVPEVPKAPEAPPAPVVPEVDEPEVAKAPVAPPAPEVPKVEVPELPKVPALPEAPPAPAVPEAPKVDAETVTQAADKVAIAAAKKVAEAKAEAEKKPKEETMRRLEAVMV